MPALTQSASRSPQPIGQVISTMGHPVLKDKSTQPQNTAVLKDTPIAVDPVAAPRPPIQAVLKDRVSNEHIRPWVKVRLPKGAFDVERIVGNWKAENQASPRLAAAIRLYDAVLQGNVEQIRQMVPLLGVALQPPPPKRQKRAAPPPLESDSLKIQDSESERGSDLAQAIVEVTAIDYQLNTRSVDTLATKLEQAGYTAEEVRRWHTEWWLVHDWRGKKGERPGLKQVQELIGRIKTLQPLPPVALAAPVDLNDPALVSDEDFEAHLKERYHSGDTRPTLTQGYEADSWQAMMAEMAASVGAATFSAWLQRLRLVAFAKGHDGVDRFEAIVPDIYCKDWIEKFALPGMRRKLTWLYTHRQRAPDKQVQIVIEVEDECRT